MAQGLLHTMKSRIGGIFLLCPVIEPNFDKRVLPSQTAVVATSRSEELYQRYILPGLQDADADFIARYKKKAMHFLLAIR